MLAGAGAVAGLIAVLLLATRALQSVISLGEAFRGFPTAVKSNEHFSARGPTREFDMQVRTPGQRPAPDEPRRGQRPSTPETPQAVEDLQNGAPHFAGLIEKSEAELAAEDKDPAWAPAMEAQILAEISRKALGLEITDLQVECRTTLCRVEMLFPQRLLQKNFQDVANAPAWNGQQPVGSFIGALDLDFRQPVPSGLDRYGDPVVVAYVAKRQRPEPQ